MKKSFLYNLLSTIIVGGVIATMFIFNIFEKFEFRLYDALLHLTKDPPFSEKIIAVEIDDQDINKLGDWPWSRNILGDTLLRMKELGAQQVIFDIEYISPSPKSVASNAEDNINNKIYEVEGITNDLLKSLANSGAKGGWPVKELPSLANNMISENLYPSFSDLYEFVENNVSYDNDEYFGKCLQFFGNSWLTVNNNDLGYTSISQEDIDYIRNKMLIYEVRDPDNTVLKNNDSTFKESYNGTQKGFTPALHTMIKRARGVGFTNSNVDSDGTRRRMELLYVYDGKYLPQLAFGPLLNILDATKITRTKSSLVVHDALFPGEDERVDFRIPLDENGRMLVNWQHDSVPKDKNDKTDFDEIPEDRFYHFGIKNISVYPIHSLDTLENDIYKNMYKLFDEYVIFDQDGYPLQFVTQAAQLVDDHDSLDEFKNYLLNNCTGINEDGSVIDGIRDSEYEQYFSARQNFFDGVQNYVNANHLAQIYGYLESVTDMSGDIDTNADLAFYYDLKDIFDELSESIATYKFRFNKIKNMLDGRYCVIGQTAASTTDIGSIPFVKQYSNVLIHTNVYNTILTRNFITPLPWYIGFGVSLIVCLLLLTLCNSSTVIQNLVGGVVRILVMVAFVILFVVFQIYIPMLSTVFLFLITDYLSGVIYRYLQSSKEKKFITEIASSFANKETVAQLRANPDAFKTEGEKKVITALFSDIQKFSTFSESINRIYGEDGPNKLIQVLNEYLGQMSDEILINKGNIDKYEGDAIISMFGAPDTFKEHSKEEWAYLCLDSAIRMKKAEVKFNATHEDLFDPVEISNEDGTINTIKLNPLQTRIGINTGDAYVGLMGSKTDSFSKLNYTMIGDTVNLASRLEGVNKAYNTWIMCSEDTWKLANSGENFGKITVRRLDKVRVVGKTIPVQLYNVIGFTDELSPVVKQQLEVFETALDKYLNKDFVNAGKLFVEASKMGDGDPTSLIFADRCKTYIKKGVPEDWDGVMNMTNK